MATCCFTDTILTLRAELQPSSGIRVNHFKSFVVSKEFLRPLACSLDKNTETSATAPGASARQTNEMPPRQMLHAYSLSIRMDWWCAESGPRRSFRLPTLSSTSRTTYCRDHVTAFTAIHAARYNVNLGGTRSGTWPMDNSLLAAKLRQHGTAQRLQAVW